MSERISMRHASIISRILLRINEQAWRAIQIDDKPTAFALWKLIGRIQYAAFGGASIGEL